MSSPTYGKPVRVYELARRLDVPNKDLIERLQKMGLDIKVPSNTIPAETANRLVAEAEAAKTPSPTSQAPTVRRETTPSPTPQAPTVRRETTPSPTPQAPTVRRETTPSPTSQTPSREATPLRTPRAEYPRRSEPRTLSQPSSSPRRESPRYESRREEPRKPKYAARQPGSPPPPRPLSSPETRAEGARRVAYSSREETNQTTRSYHSESLRTPETAPFSGPRSASREAPPRPIRPLSPPAVQGFSRPQPKRLQARDRDKDRDALRERERERDVASRSRPKEESQEFALPQRDEIIEVEEGISVSELARKLGVRPSQMVAQLFKMGILVTVNQALDMETLKRLEEPFQFIATKRPSLEEELTRKAEAVADDPRDLVPRAPVVTIMGHVDHGKTSLLDAVRESNVAAREAGNITQHIGAYDVHLPNGRVVFLDTPGHEAFTAMRARGAQVTDVVVLVVAADDGVMPQTVEALNHARAANVPVVVAINKIDVPDANVNRVKDQLARLGLVPEEWGGQTVFCEISAKQRIGISELLEYLALETELLELKANPNRSAVGTVIEAKLDKGRGPVATVLVQNGTLRVGDYFAAGSYDGRVRALINDRGERISSAGPSTPVEVLGCNGVPTAGDRFLVLSEQEARALAERRQQLLREEKMVQRRRVSLEDLHRQITEGEVKELNLILKTDVEGSIEAILAALSKLETQQVKINVLHQGVGGITESDVMLAAASSAIILGFNVRPTTRAERLARQEGIDIRTYDVIYNLVNDIRSAMEGMLEPEFHEQVLGRATIRELFRIPRFGVVAGCYVNNGRIVRGMNLRVVRDNRVVHEGKVDSLRRFKEDVTEVAAGYECGVGMSTFNDFHLNDVLECYTVEKVTRTLSPERS